MDDLRDPGLKSGTPGIGEATGNVVAAVCPPAHPRATWLAACRAKVAELCRVDLRSLAAIRIGLATLLIIDLIGRSRDLVAHYTDAGILPRSVLFENEGLRSYLSLHVISGSAYWQIALFLLAGYFAFKLLLGIRTRLSTFASWVLLLSLHHRNPVVLQSGDALLRLMLFWGMMLPLGARWSIDATAGPLKLCHRKDNSLLSVAGVAMMLQVCLVYWFTATFKDHPMWWHRDAAYYALNVDQLVTSFGLWIRQIDWLLPILTWTAFGLAIAAPLLVFCPIWTGWTRMLVIVAMIGTHLALAMSLKLGLLPYVAALSWIIFIPSNWWDWIKNHSRRNKGLRASPPRSRWWFAILNWLPTGLSISRRGTGDVLIDIPTDRQQGIRARGWEQVVASLAMVYVVVWNLQWLNTVSAEPFVPVQVAAGGDVLRMEQGWNMISPKAEALDYDGYFVMPAELADGSHIDVFTGRPVNWSDPQGHIWHDPGTRWRRYLRNLAKPDFKYYLHPFAEYLAKSYDEAHPPSEHIKSFDIIFMHELPLPNGGYQLQREELLHYVDMP